MTVKVLFFARIKEQLDCSELTLEWAENTSTLDNLHEFLRGKNNNSWRGVLSEGNIIRAVNKIVVTGDSPLSDGDEIAFFPPVTGG